MTLPAAIVVEEPLSPAPPLHRLLHELSILRDIDELAIDEQNETEKNEDGPDKEQPTDTPAFAAEDEPAFDPGESISLASIPEWQPRLSRTQRTVREWSSTRDLASLLPEHPLWQTIVLDWTVTVIVGFLVVSYWRVRVNRMLC
jgi:hypothetical protein